MPDFEEALLLVLDAPPTDAPDCDPAPLLPLMLEPPLDEALEPDMLAPLAPPTLVPAFILDEVPPLLPLMPLPDFDELDEVPPALPPLMLDPLEVPDIDEPV